MNINIVIILLFSVTVASTDLVDKPSLELFDYFFSKRGVQSGYRKKTLTHNDISCEAFKKCRAGLLRLLVCGTDNKQYLNLGVFACAKMCNEELKLAKFGACQLHPMTTTTTPPPDLDYVGIDVDVDSFEIEPGMLGI